MTANEIIKALQYCKEHNGMCTDDCIYRAMYSGNCASMLQKDTINLINRQQAENEQLRQLFVESGKEQDRLMAEIERLEEQYKFLEDNSLIFKGGIDYFKAEAIKEFAEKLHELLKFYYPEQKFVHTHIDNLVK